MSEAAVQDVRDHDFQQIVVDLRDDGIARVKLNNPDKRNAISVPMMRDMRTFLDLTKRDRDICAVIIEGEGSDFCSGHDLLAHEDLGGTRRPWRENQSRDYLEFIGDHWYWPLKDYSKPLIAAVHGHAMAGGAELALLCDITIASPDAVFGYDILRVTGVVPSIMLVWTAGWKKALEIYLTGGRVEAEEAHRLGMVNRVVSRENLAAEAMRLATIITRIPQEIVRLNKLAVRHAFDLMGMREAWFYGTEADILAHLVEGDEIESNMRHEQGVTEAVRWRRERFEDLDQPLT